MFSQLVKQNPKAALLASYVFFITATLSSLLIWSTYTNYYHENILHAESKLEYIRHSNIQSLTKNTNAMALEIYKLKSKIIQTGLLKVNETFDPKRLTSLFIEQIHDDSLVSQLRWIDEKGNEQVRVDRKLNLNGSWSITSDAPLQNKAKRYYFEKTLALPPSELFVSHLDLNIENDQIVQPYEPTLRVSLKTSPQEGISSGILILNYNLSSVFNGIINKTKSDFFFLWFSNQNWYINTQTPSLAWSAFNSNDLVFDKNPEKQAEIISRIDANTQIKEEIGTTYISSLNLINSLQTYIISGFTPNYLQAIHLRSIQQVIPLSLFFLLIAVLISLFFYSYEKRLLTNNQALQEQASIARNNTEYKSLFLANMSHEIRTPLTSIIGLLDLIKLDELEKKVSDKILTVKRSAKSLLSIINDILDLTKIESGKLALESRVFLMSEVADNVINLFSIDADRKNIELVLSVDPAITEFQYMGDDIRLSQVLNNLVNNAIKFTEAGMVRLSVSLKHQNDENVDVLFTIKDTGIGIAPDVTERLLEPFEQADISTTRHYGGTGLGLSICKELIEMMGSTLTIQSQPEVGSVFSFLVNFPTRENKQKSQSLNTLGLPKRIMVVDDNISVCKTLKEMFTFWGSNCDTFLNAKDAYKAFKEAHENNDGYELLYIDWKMPDEDGLTLAKKIENFANKNKVSQPYKTVMITASLRSEILSEKNYSDDLNLLLKPVTISKLMESLQHTGVISSPTKPPATTINTAITQLKEKLNAATSPAILIVEDNLDNQVLLTEIFKSFGLTIEIADNGEQAIDFINNKPYDLVFMDVQMPVLDGISATKIIRKQFTGNQLPIIALSAASYQKRLKIA
ncbi:response regulator [Colwelliaceae bacterium 6441]